MNDKHKYYNTRTQIAEYLRVTRQTLYRWEKILCLTYCKGLHVRMQGYQVDEWKEKMITKDHKLRQQGHYVRE